MENLRLKYGDVELPIQQGYTITKSSQEVSYSDLVCGWDDSYELPERYQEVQIVNIDTEVVKAYGYIDMYDFGEMRETDVERDITISLFTPMKLATLRTVIANGTYQLVDLIQNHILSPLIADGFLLSAFDIADRQITTNFNLETVEFCMNNLSNKFNFWWYIDEHKKIYIKDIEVLKSANPKYTYDDNNMIEGLQYLKPITESDNYANVVNFKNVRTYQLSQYENWESPSYPNRSYNPLIDNDSITLKKGDEIIFKYPIDIKKENVLKSIKSEWEAIKNIYGVNLFDNSETDAFAINVKCADNVHRGTYIKIGLDGQYSMHSDLSIDTENRDTMFVLISDPFFSNLMTGIRYNGDSNVTRVELIQSAAALIWNYNRFYNDKEIEKKKGKISESGIVETTVDMNASWKTVSELTDIAKTYLNKNSLENANKIELLTDADILEIGDLIKINKFNINSTYIVISINEKNSKNESEYIVKIQNANSLSNFIDVFRNENTQQDESQEYELFVTHYTDEGFVQETEVII